MDKSNYPKECFKRHKTASATGLRLCYEVKNLIYVASHAPIKKSKAHTSLNKYIARFQVVLSGDHVLSREDGSMSEIADSLALENYPLTVLENMNVFDFDELKELLNIIVRLLPISAKLDRNVTENTQVIVKEVFRRYAMVDYFLIGGLFIRDLLRFPAIHERVLTVENVDHLHWIVMETSFGVASDALESFKTWLLSEERFVLDFLLENSAFLFEKIRLICYKDYYDQRQGLNFLFNLLTTRGNIEFADLYARDAQNIKEMMNLMNDSESDQVKNESFYLFEVIVKRLVAGLPKTKKLPAFKILVNNKDELVLFFKTFLESQDHEEFKKDKHHMIKTLRNLNK